MFSKQYHEDKMSRLNSTEPVKWEKNSKENGAKTRESCMKFALSWIENKGDFEYGNSV